MSQGTPFGSDRKCEMTTPTTDDRLAKLRRWIEHQPYVITRKDVPGLIARLDKMEERVRELERMNADQAESLRKGGELARREALLEAERIAYSKAAYFEQLNTNESGICADIASMIADEIHDLANKEASDG